MSPCWALPRTAFAETIAPNPYKFACALNARQATAAITWLVPLALSFEDSLEPPFPRNQAQLDGDPCAAPTPRTKKLPANPSKVGLRTICAVQPGTEAASGRAKQGWNR